jgi:integrase
VIGRRKVVTLLGGAATHPKVVQERLGHASIQLTLDSYSHVLPSMQEDAAATIDAAMRAAH